MRIRLLLCVIGRHDYRYDKWQVSGAAVCHRCGDVRPVGADEDIGKYLRWMSDADLRMRGDELP